MNLIATRELAHHRQLAKNLRQRFRIARTRRRFSVVLRELQRIRQQKCIQSRGGARRPGIFPQPHQPQFLVTQMELPQQFRIAQRGSCHTLAELRHRLGYIPHPLFIFRRKKKRPQKRTVYAVAKSEFCLTQSLVEIFREFRRATQLRLEQLVPLFGCRAGGRTPRRSRRRSHTHFVFAPPLPEPTTELLADPLREIVAVAFAAAVCADFGAPVNPAAAPTPSISSHFGQGFDGAPLSARSITSRAIFSTTMSK